MSPHNDFSLDDPVGPPADPAAADPEAEPGEGEAPVVVVQYRERGWASLLLPPTLILLVAATILAIHRPTPELPPPARTSPVARADRSADPAPPDRAARSEEPIVLKVEAAPPAPAAEPALPLPAAQPQARDVAAAPAAAVGFRRPGPADEAAELALSIPPAPELPPSSAAPAALSMPTAVPEPQPEPLKIDADQIARRAAELRARRESLAQIKVLEERRKQTEAQRRIEEQRTLFHKELLQILRSRTKWPGSAITGVCGRYDTAMPEALVESAKRSLGRRLAGLNTLGRIRLYRRLGAPEAGILLALAEDQRKLIGSRGGPRDVDDAMVRAAKLLLGVPLATSRTEFDHSVQHASARPAR